MEELLRDVFELTGLSCRGPIRLKAIFVYDGITHEVIIVTFTEFCKSYDITNAYIIELDNPTLPPFLGESFEVNKMVLTFRRLEEDWDIRIHTEDEEISHSFMENLKDKLKGRKVKILKLVRMVWKLLEIFLSGQSPASSP